MKLGRLLEERETGMRFDHILHEGDEVLGAQPAAASARQDVDEARGRVVASAGHPVPEGQELLLAAASLVGARGEIERSLPVQRKLAGGGQLREVLPGGAVSDGDEGAGDLGVGALELSGSRGLSGREVEARYVDVAVRPDVSLERRVLGRRLLHWNLKTTFKS